MSNELEAIRARVEPQLSAHHSWLSWAEEDRRKLLAALEATLALCETWKKEFNARNEGEAMLRAAAHIISAAITTALEETK